jgi:hypothetical protein
VRGFNFQTANTNVICEPTQGAVIVRLDRTIQYAAASRIFSASLEYWIPAFAGMTTSFADTAPRYRGLIRPRFARNFLTLQSEGAGNAGRSMRPQPRREIKNTTSVVTTVTPVSPGIPRAMVYGLFRALPGDRACLPPSSADLSSANLTPASGRQDHTSSPSASAPFVIGASASTASRPAAVTIACRPSVGRDGYSYSLICISEKQKYFCGRGWTSANREAN